MCHLAVVSLISQALSVLVAPANPVLDYSTIQRQECSVLPGVSYVSIKVPETPCEVRMVKFDLSKNKDLRLEFALCKTNRAFRLTPEGMAKKTAKETGRKAVAAMNGDFFLYNKGTPKNDKPLTPERPFGITLSQGKLLERGCWGARGYEIIGRRKDGSLGFGKLSSEGEGESFKAYMDGAEVTDAIRVWNRPLQNGKVIDGAVHVCYPKDNHKNYPRSLVGLGTNLVVFLVADARQVGWSLGMPSAHAAEILKREGCTDAGQFDGGGSTALWLSGKNYLNRPSDGKPRPVANGLVVTQ
jgi:exopolysaccharide biosynthesis protein